MKNKINNPTITDNNDVNVFNNLETVINSADDHFDDSKIKKSKTALRGEFNRLILGCFGTVKAKVGSKFYDLNEDEKKPYSNGVWDLYKSTGWWKNKTQVVSIEPLVSEFEDFHENIHIFNESFNDIRIRVHEQDFLSKAKKFANAYENYTGKKAEIVQNFPDDVKINNAERKVNNPVIKQLGVERLERKVKLPKKLTNKIEVTDEDKVYVYQGFVWGVHFEGGDIRCGVGLRKYLKTGKKKKKLVKLFPPKIGKVDKLKKQWDFSTFYNHHYMISNGTVYTESDRDYNCRGKIKSMTANEGIFLSDKLLNQVYGPIEQEILKVYNNAY